MPVTNDKAAYMVTENGDSIYVTLQYEQKAIRFPVNPEQLKKVVSSSAVTEKIEGLGEISIPQTPSLTEVTLTSFFWKDKDITSPKTYIRWLEEWQASRKPAYLIVSRYDWNMQVTCEELTHWVNAGEEDDIYFEISLKEYRTYGADEVFFINGKFVSVAEASKNIPVLVAKHTPLRSAINKAGVDEIFSIKNSKQSTIASLTKEATGSTKDWKELWTANREPCGKVVSNMIKSAKTADELNKSISAVAGSIKNVEERKAFLTELIVQLGNQ
nr:MAG TPA: tail assembly protein [Caudoviricetes sp.]